MHVCIFLAPRGAAKEQGEKTEPMAGDNQAIPNQLKGS